MTSIKQSWRMFQVHPLGLLMCPADGWAKKTNAPQLCLCSWALSYIQKHYWFSYDKSLSEHHTSACCNKWGEVGSLRGSSGGKCLTGGQQKHDSCISHSTCARVVWAVLCYLEPDKALIVRAGVRAVRGPALYTCSPGLFYCHCGTCGPVPDSAKHQRNRKQTGQRRLNDNYSASDWWGWVMLLVLRAGSVKRDGFQNGWNITWAVLRSQRQLPATLNL